MEFGSIERELHIDAPPEVVFDVISRPEHIRDWWNAETEIEPVAGSAGELVWDDDMTAQITVVEADPPRRFSFRWTQASLLAIFDLTPSGDGTRLRLTETGFREQGWELAKLEEAYNDHVEGWERYLPRLAETATRVATA